MNIKQIPTCLTLLIIILVYPCSCFGEREVCWLAYEDYEPLQDPKTGEKYFAKSGKFLGKYTYNPGGPGNPQDSGDVYQADGTEYYLLKFANGTPFGWCDKRYVIRNKALLQKLDGLPPGAPPPPIHRKVRLSNSENYLATRPGDESLNEVTVYDRPVENDRYKIGKFKLSTMMFVYSETGQFVLLGHNAEFQDTSGQELSVENVMKGWVRKDRCIEWNTRQALEWNWRNHSIRNQPAVIFSELDRAAKPSLYDRKLTENKVIAYLQKQKTLEQLIESGASKEKIEEQMGDLGVFSREPFEMVKGRLQLKRMAPTALRMPLLNKVAISLKEDFSGPSSWELAAPALSGAGEIAVPDTTPADQFKRLDVVLIIDATSSMREEIVASLIAVMNLAEELKNQPMSIQFAFVFFRDRQEQGDDWIKTIDYVPLPDRNVFLTRNVELAYENVKECFREERPDSQLSINASKKSLQALVTASNEPFFQSLQRAHSVQATGGGLAPESVFLGVNHALTNLQKDQSKSLKLRIVVGDRGDNGKADNGDPPISDKDLTRRLIGRRQIPSLLAVLNVDGVKGLQLERDFEPIVQQLNAEFNEGTPVSNRFTAAEVIRLDRNQRTVASKVAQLVTDVIQKAKIERVKLIQAAETGDYSQLTPLGKKALEASGVDITQLKKKQGEVFRKALTPVKSPSREDIRSGNLTQNAVRVNVLMTVKEAERLYNTLNSLVGNDIIPKQIKSKSLKGLIREATASVVGDKFNTSGLSFSKALSTITGVPATSSLLESASKIDELAHPDNRENFLKELKRLTEIRRRLRDALDDRYSEITWDYGKDADDFDVMEMKCEYIYPFGDGNQPPRSFQFGGLGEFYMWIDLDLEYP